MDAIEALGHTRRTLREEAAIVHDAIAALRRDPPKTDIAIGLLQSVVDRLTTMYNRTAHKQET